jgi:RND family efflux transporter MFP subunit
MSRWKPWVIFASIVLVALAVGAGLRWLGRERGAQQPIVPGAPAAQTQAQVLYHCPMHPTMVSDRPGDCPICGMRMVPMDDPAGAEASPQSGPSAAAPRKRIIYRSTMNPSEVSDSPGKDSMGMEMEPVEVEEGAAPAAGKVEGQAAVRVSARKQQLIGVRTTVVRRAPFVRTIRTVGRVTADETRLHHVHTKIEGWVEKLHVNATGEKVRKGDPLLSIYSPELVATQQEYLLALRSRRSVPAGSLPEVERGADELVDSARRRLLLFDFTPEQIDHLEKTGEASWTVTLFAPMSGYVLARNVTHGEKIDSSMNLLDIGDLSEIWVIASVYEYELPFVKAGQSAAMSLSYLPGKTYRGRVGLVYPVLDQATRTVQARLEFENPGLDLKPDMYAHVELESDLGERLTVPESAVLSSGTRDIVFVAKGDGYFEPREVRVGLRLPGAVEVLEGLSEGESVVASGNFLIDSESKLKAALEAAAAQRPAPAGKTEEAPAPAPEHQH